MYTENINKNIHVKEIGYLPYASNPNKKHQSNTVYSKNGISPCLMACDWKAPIKIIDDKRNGNLGNRLEKYKFNNEPIRVLEFFSGVGMQRMAFDKLGVNYESVGTSEIDIPAILSYAAIHDGLLESDETFEYPTKEEMLNYLTERNIGLDFKTGKLKLPKNLDKIKQLYRATILSKCLGDISKINPSELPDFDFMTYSSPCQDFSVAGKQQGAIRGQTRSGLLYECEKVIEHKRPKYLLLENVKNLVGKQFKPQFDEWLEYLESLGYSNYWKVLNSKSFGIPQNRERVFVLSILGEHDPYKFHSGFELNIRLKDILESEVDEKYYLSKEVQDRFKSNKGNQVIEKLMKTNQIDDDLVTCDLSINDPKVKDVSNCITARQDRGISNQKSVGCGVVERIICEQRVDEGLRFFKDDICGCLRTIDACGDKRIIELEPLICASRGRNVENPSDRTPGIHTEQRLEINYSGASNTITTVQKDNYVLETNFRIRKLTPKECWRLMGIDDECFDKAQQVNSNSQLYKQAGNGIVVDVLYYIFKQLFKDNIVE